MRILYVSTGSRAHDGKIVNELVRRGYDVHYALLRRDPTPLASSHVQTTCLGYDDSAGGGSARRMISFGLSYARSYTNLRRIIRSFRPHVLHATFIQTAGLLSAVTGFHPLLLSPWGSDVLGYPRQSPIMRLLTQYVVGRSDGVFCDSDSVRRTLAELTGRAAKTIRVIPWGVSLDAFRQDNQIRLETRRELGLESNKVVIMTRNFYPVYGISFFLESLPAVLKDQPTAKLLMIGSGPLEQDLRQLARRLGIENSVRFLGEVAAAEMPRYLNSADIYVSSSLSDGTSVSLLEAMACGLPVVVTDVPANLEWVRDGANGLVARREDSKGLSDRITSLLGDEQARTEMSARNIAKVRERADWDANFTLIERFYHELAGEGPGW